MRESYYRDSLIGGDPALMSAAGGGGGSDACFRLCAFFQRLLPGKWQEVSGAGTGVRRPYPT